MTHSPLRLVIGHAGQNLSEVIEIPDTPALHLHLYLGMASHPVGPAATAQGQPAKPLWRPFLIGAVSLVMALLAFDLGAHLGAGHARAEAGEQAIANRLPLPPIPAELPQAMRERLAQPPTITPPPGSPPDASTPNPFGLHP
jgi:hypothetical protein